MDVKGRDKDEEEVLTKPLHKKNPEVGEKKQVFSSKLVVEQEDAASFGDNEEVSRGNPFVCVCVKLTHASGDIYGLG